MKRHLICGFALTLLLVPAGFAQVASEAKPEAAHDCAAMMGQHDAMQKYVDSL